MAPIGINGIETVLTAELAQKFANNLTHQEKIEMINACQKNIAEILETSTDESKKKIGKLTENSEKLTKDDIKITIFGNAYGWIQAGEEGMGRFRDNLYDGSKESHQGYIGEMNGDGFSNKRLYRISYPTLEQSGRAGGQAGIGIEMNKEYRISTDKITNTLREIYSAGLINNGYLKKIPNRPNNREAPYFSRQKNPKRKELEDLARNLKKGVVDRLNKQEDIIIRTTK